METYVHAGNRNRESVCAFLNPSGASWSDMTIVALVPFGRSKASCRIGRSSLDVFRRRSKMLMDFRRDHTSKWCHLSCAFICSGLVPALLPETPWRIPHKEQVKPLGAKSVRKIGFTAGGTQNPALETHNMFLYMCSCVWAVKNYVRFFFKHLGHMRLPRSDIS